jgi:hypothetical protein
MVGTRRTGRRNAQRSSGLMKGADGRGLIALAHVAGFVAVPSLFKVALLCKQSALLERFRKAL